MLRAMSLIGVTTHFVFSTIARADYQTDLSAFEQGDFATAERIFSDLAQQGDADGLLHRAMEQLLVPMRITGNTDSQRFTGLLLQLSKALEGDPDEVCAVYRMSPQERRHSRGTLFLPFLTPGRGGGRLGLQPRRSPLHPARGSGCRRSWDPARNNGIWWDLMGSGGIASRSSGNPEFHKKQSTALPDLSDRRFTTCSSIKRRHWFQRLDAAGKVLEPLAE